MEIHNIKHINFSLDSKHHWTSLSKKEPSPFTKTPCFICLLSQHNLIIVKNIREGGSTLYVGLQHAVPPTNTKFNPLLLPTQAGIPYTKSLISTEHHISSLHSHFWVQLSSGSIFLQTNKNGNSYFFIINIIFNFKIFFSLRIRRDFSMLLKQILISIGSYFPEVCAFGTLTMFTEAFTLIICVSR